MRNITACILSAYETLSEQRQFEVELGFIQVLLHLTAVIVLKWENIENEKKNTPLLLLICKQNGRLC